MQKKETILITGALGQIGTELCTALRLAHGPSAVVASDLHEPAAQQEGPFIRLNVLDRAELEAVIVQHGVTQVYHLAAMLSAKGEQNPGLAWNLNMTGLMNVLNVAKIFKLRVFWPSSIAVFGPSSPKVLCPQHTLTAPVTMYGISKLAGELLCAYYHEHYGVDVRSLRLPGLVSHTAKPGGGTTDYAVEIFHHAVQYGQYTCFLKEETTLPMLYMPDAVRAIRELMNAPADKIRIGMAYNIGGMSFSPKQLAAAIRNRLPGFQVRYHPDSRQQIADSWPASVDYPEARKDWNWQAEYDLAAMCAGMLGHIVRQQAGEALLNARNMN